MTVLEGFEREATEFFARTLAKVGRDVSPSNILVRGHVSAFIALGIVFR